MKTLKLLFGVLALAAFAVAQNGPAGPNVRLMSGSAAASAISCDSTSAGAVYTQTTAPPVTSVCQQITVGAYSWVGVPAIIACGATSGGTANCANTFVVTPKIYYDSATLASNASVITLSPGFTSTTTAVCTASDITTRANVVQCVVTNGTTLTITNTTGATDVISYIAVGY